jgi:hypothetical protein
MAEFGIFEVLGRLVSQQPGSRLLIFDRMMRADARRLVREVNRLFNLQHHDSNDLDGGVDEEPFRSFVLDDCLKEETSFEILSDTDRPLRFSGDKNLWILELPNEGNLVNLRNGSICAAFKFPDDGSNDENTFPIWLDLELPDERRLRMKDISAVIVDEIFPSLSGGDVEQLRDDAVSRISSSLQYVAETYSSLGRVERASVGTLWLRHVDIGIKRLGEAVARREIHAPNDCVQIIAEAAFPSMSLPNPSIDNRYQLSRKTGSAKSVAEAISKFWCEDQEGNHVTDSLKAVDEVRTTASPRRDPALLSEIDWSSLRRTWNGEGLSSDFLTWHVHRDVSVASENSEVERWRCLENLDEEEFFAPLPPRPELVDGSWEDGRPLRPPQVDTDIVILSPTTFAAESRLLTTEALVLRVTPRQGVPIASLDLGGVSVIVRPAKGKRIPTFVQDSIEIDPQTKTILVKGCFELAIPGRGEFSYKPEVFGILVGGPSVASGQEMRALALPPSGAGYLIGKNLKYVGTTKFDSQGDPIWSEDMLAESDDDAVEFGIRKKPGELVDVIFWSVRTPQNVETDGHNRDVWTDCGAIRWAEQLSARRGGHECEVRGI